ncbi:MAG TPA: DUF1772 domain-containing protein [Acidobacteriaceae bacterium]|jgi:uncharacterized membrane protein|nr:DUF1772 domain-containing protein [Acidobacteriaceae bacterium]
MTSLLNLATAVCVGLMVGVEFAVSVFVNPVIWKLDDRAQVRAIRLFAARLGTAMPFWYVLSLLLLLAEAIVLRHTPGVVLIEIAGGIWIAVIVLTLLFLVPINNRMIRMEPDAFSDKDRRDHRKWDGLHRLRIAALIAAMICLFVAIGL